MSIPPCENRAMNDKLITMGGGGGWRNESGGGHGEFARPGCPVNRLQRPKPPVVKSIRGNWWDLLPKAFGVRVTAVSFPLFPFFRLPLSAFCPPPRSHPHFKCPGDIKNDVNCRGEISPLPRMCLNGRMAKQSHKVGDGQTPTAESFARDGGARFPQRAPPANRRVQAIPTRGRQPLRYASAAHSGGGLAVERVRASQPLLHARGALRRTRPTHPPDSR
jgi:hypothetical protein